MAQDENTSRCSNSSSCGGGGGGDGGGGSSHRSAKKLKHKKVPQRGMGVAQLEKIISEEQQKKVATVFTHNSIISPSNSSSNFRLPVIPSSSIPLPPNQHPLIFKINGINTISAFKPRNSIGGHGNWGRLLTDGDYNVESEKQSRNQNHNQNHGLDHPRCTAAFPVILESNPPIWPPPNLMLQRSPHFEQPCSSSMVNVSAGTSSSSSSSVPKFQMEPPSNQSYYGINYHFLWPEEEKMVGMKRPYPFLLDNMPIPSFHSKFPPVYVSPVSKSDESASCSNGGIVSIEPANPSFREHLSSSVAISDEITKKFIDENQVLTRDFLKLDPPQAFQSSSNENLHLSPCIGEHFQFETQPPQGQPENPSHLFGRGGSSLPLFLGFFPAARTSWQPGYSNDEAGESVDLNLKL